MKNVKISFRRFAATAGLTALLAFGVICLSGCDDNKNTGPATLVYELTVSSAGTGASGDSSYAAGATVSISAGTPPSGQWFKNWTASGGGVIFANAKEAATTFTMPANAVAVTAVFEKAPVSIEMVSVAGGTFTMGCTSEQGDACWNDDEIPSHSVTLSGYYIGKYEVTQGLWKAVMGSLPDPSRLLPTFTWGYGLGDNYPIYVVSWNDAQTFIKTLNNKSGKTYRLPTEAEWEFAARGGNSSRGYKYSGSDTLENVAWYRENTGTSGSANYGTRPVGTKSPNELGIYDMSGNVSEWVNDEFDAYSSNAQTNPTGPLNGYGNVFRGGGWSDISPSRYGKDHYRVSARDRADFRLSSDLGFRLALSEK
jgi:formylglycine-generating enzyme required for sulfatase activity